MGKPRRPPRTKTNKKEAKVIISCPNGSVVEAIKEKHRDPDLHYGHRCMTTQLQILGYQINHKKVYRLMKENKLLHTPAKPLQKEYAKYRIVIPEQPLSVLEMDIKFVWIENKRKHAFVLSIIDTFTRVILNWTLGFSITQNQVKQLWESVIVNHLQVHNMLNKKIDIEVRNDNDPRFSAKMVQSFFKDNHLNQVFTHPYTPQENGHIESFHSILSKALKSSTYWELKDLELRLTLYFEKYNNVRLHGSITHLPPNIFWEQWEKGNIQRTVVDKKKVKFKLKIPYRELSGNINPKEASCINSEPLDGARNLIKEQIDVNAVQQPSV